MSMVKLLLNRGANVELQVSFMIVFVKPGHCCLLFNNQTFKNAVSSGCLSTMDLLLSAGVGKYWNLNLISTLMIK